MAPRDFCEEIQKSSVLVAGCRQPRNWCRDSQTFDADAIAGDFVSTAASDATQRWDQFRP